LRYFSFTDVKTETPKMNYFVGRSNHSLSPLGTHSRHFVINLLCCVVLSR